MGIRRFQTLMGMGQWARTKWRLDIDFQHFDYLNNKLYRWIVPDLQSLLTNDELQTNSFHSDFFKDYPNDASGTLMSPCPRPMDAS